MADAARNRIAVLRKARNISQEELADRLATTRKTVSELERGRQQLTQDWMERIAAALDCRPQDLLPSYGGTLPVSDDLDDDADFFVDVEEAVDALFKSEGIAAPRREITRTAFVIYNEISARAGLAAERRRLLADDLEHRRRFLREYREKILANASGARTA